MRRETVLCDYCGAEMEFTDQSMFKAGKGPPYKALVFVKSPDPDRDDICTKCALGFIESALKIQKRGTVVGS